MHANAPATKSIILGAIVSAVMALTVSAQLDTTGLIGYWKLDDPAGSAIAQDSSLKGYHGSVIGGNSIAPNTFGVPGVAGTAWQIDTAPEDWPNMKSDYIQLPVGDGDELRLGGGPYTLTGWFKAVDLLTSGNAHLFSSALGAGGDGVTVSLLTGVHFGVVTTNETSLVLNQPGSQLFELFEPVNGLGLIDTNFWYFWAVRFDTTNASLWFVREDQSFSQGDSDTAAASISAGQGIPHIGRIGAAGGFDGMFDEVSAWDRALSDTEVEEIFDLGAAGQPLPDPPAVTVEYTEVAVDNVVTFDFETKNGRSFRLQYTTDPVAGSWTDADFLVLGDGSVLSATVAAGGDASRIYRVEQQ